MRFCFQVRCDSHPPGLKTVLVLKDTETCIKCSRLGCKRVCNVPEATVLKTARRSEDGDRSKASERFVVEGSSFPPRPLGGAVAPTCRE